MYIDYLATPSDSPLGFLQIKATEEGITHIDFTDERSEPIAPHPLIEDCKHQLEEYFQGRRQAFDVPLAPQGTDFQQRVWRQLREIPYGETCSYATISRGIGNPRSHRAVGAANGRNPLSIIVPCHRVIGSDGQLTGYAGGLERKQWLLRHEQAHREYRLQP
ncbi:methylated-DNA-[protein]-cysteine S-methyltransferase [Modicisalibacter ilicicola DSM 19980]|uniref:Methylated-DNA--protein-cysteine methyltransferase n=1 Tax=Modicisalibacter ilicicola DSM 19980 TaxID=1121942 RepID=A0A1M4TKK2_9GAMM|nr:methylated-DNA--[protein]-cysteine S-methyltransferase [Halomonas ilicicola]SHE44990.1 methylated-DNA-[protein]-cysteine S-methyltransferase [Halomonas ilicicola DSM 19980]